MAAVYATDRSVFLSPLFQWSLLIVYVIAMGLAAYRQPRLGRAIATRNAFVAYILVSACYSTYYFLIFEVFDPSLVDLQSELMIENARLYLTNAPGIAADDPALTFAPDRLRQTPGGAFLNFAQGMIYGAAFSFLLGYVLGRGEVSETTDV